MNKNPKVDSTLSVDEVREVTDSSLEKERTKTDQSLAKENDWLTHQANSLLDASRAEADQDQILDRKKSDSAKERARSSLSGNISDERKIDDQNLQLERQKADEAQQHERAKADASLLKERKRLRLAAEAFLEFERRSTDANLLEERKKSDQEIHSSGKFLKGEKNAHELTKDILAIVSHDLRNPLSAITLGAETLMASLASKGSEEDCELIAIIQRNAAIMEGLIEDLIDVERIATGKIKMNLTHQALETLFKECIEIFEKVASKKSIRLIAQETMSSSLMAYMDATRISQVLSNLVGNALKYTPPGGTISLSACQYESQIEVSVKDTGIGILLSEQNRIFEKFSQLENSSRRSLGLGLYISQWLVEAHGGKIWVESKVGEGSLFKFTIPAV